MPVYPLPILIPLFLIWGAVAFFLFRWRRWAGGIFIGFSVIVLVVHKLNSNVERQIDEQMEFHILGSGDYCTVKLTSSQGESFFSDSSALVFRLRERTNQTVRVLMTGWYDYGHMRAYNIHNIDGITQ